MKRRSRWVKETISSRGSIQALCPVGQLSDGAGPGEGFTDHAAPGSHSLVVLELC